MYRQECRCILWKIMNIYNKPTTCNLSCLLLTLSICIYRLLDFQIISAPNVHMNYSRNIICSHYYCCKEIKGTKTPEFQYKWHQTSIPLRTINKMYPACNEGVNSAIMTLQSRYKLIKSSPTSMPSERPRSLVKLLQRTVGSFSEALCHRLIRGEGTDEGLKIST